MTRQTFISLFRCFKPSLTLPGLGCDVVVSVSDCGHKNIRKSQWSALAPAPLWAHDVFVTVQCPLLALLSL